MEEKNFLDLLTEQADLKKRLADVEEAIRARKKEGVKKELKQALDILEKINSDKIFAPGDDYFSDDLDTYINLTTIINCLNSFIEEVVK